MRTILLSAAACLVCLGASAGAGEGGFSAKPSAEKAGDKVKIAFTVAAPTDVEVAVLGADGKVVRHLAAGVLGGAKPPPEPLKAGLAQALEWDGRDDFEKSAAGGPFKVRVRAGTGVKFGRTISDSPYMISDVRGLAADADGNLYVLSQNFGYGTHYIQVFSADGKYLRTIMPFPANLSKESAAVFARWDEKENRPVPVNWMDCYGSFFPVKGMPPGLALAPFVTSGGGVVLYNGSSIYRLDPDGGVSKGPLEVARTMAPLGQVSGKEFWSGQQYTGGGGGAALSPDGKRLYMVAPISAKGKDGKLVRPDWPPGRIFSMEVRAGGKMEPFATLEMPDDWDKKNVGGAIGYQPGIVNGLAVDSEGRVYVNDRANGQVVVLDAEGKKIGAIPVKCPILVAVHPKTGAVYVETVEGVGYLRRKLGLVKFSGWKDPKPVAQLELGVLGSTGGPMVLSVRGDKTFIWMAGIQTSGFRVGRADVTCYEDRGTEFVAAVKLHEKDPAALGNHDCIAVDPANEDVYINDDYSAFSRYNGLTGEGGALNKIDKNFKATDLAVGPDGYLYVRTDRGLGYSGPFERLDRNLKPVPFPSGTHVLSKYIYSRFGAGYGEKGIGVGRDGKSYLSFMYGWTQYCTAGFGPDGKALKGRYLEGKVGQQGDPKAKDNLSMGYPPELTSAVVGPIPKTNGGVRVDSKGNIYIGVAQFPKDYVKPALYAKDQAWDAMVGSVVKFGPEGGEWISSDPKANRTLPADAKGIAMEAGHFMAGARQTYPGIAPFSGSYNTGRASIGKAWCDCRSARFDIDLYDRLYLPNCIDNSVSVLDNAGNLVLKFGGYGNYDSQYVPEGAKAPSVPTAYIPLGWPIGTGVSDEHVYVCDQLNRCVVRADRTYQAEAVCEVK